jgi:hypothetical protein
MTNFAAKRVDRGMKTANQILVALRHDRKALMAEFRTYGKGQEELRKLSQAKLSYIEWLIDWIQDE